MFATELLVELQTAIFFFYIWPLCALLPRDTNCRSAGGTAAAEEVGVFTEETTGYCILYLLYLDGR